MTGYHFSRLGILVYEMRVRLEAGWGNVADLVFGEDANDPSANSVHLRPKGLFYTSRTGSIGLFEHP